jgi:hypothetical protein
LANNIVKRIRERQPKQWESREFEGLVKTYHRFDDVPVESGQWLIMASTNYMLNPIHEWLKSIGVLFERNGVPSLSPQIAQAVVDWERLRKGQPIGFTSVQTVYRYLDTSAVARGYKTFKTGDTNGLYTIDELKEKHGLLTDAIWHEVLTKIADDKKEYLISLLRRGVKLSQPPRVRLSPPSTVLREARRTTSCCSWISAQSLPKNMRATRTTYTACSMSGSPVPNNPCT